MLSTSVTLTLLRDMNMVQEAEYFLLALHFLAFFNLGTANHNHVWYTSVALH